MKPLHLFLTIVVALSMTISISGCNEGDDTGDTNDGDNSEVDGDATDGDSILEDGDRSTVDGDNTDGDDTDGDMADGDTTDGKWDFGDPPEIGSPCLKFEDKRKRCLNDDQIAYCDCESPSYSSCTWELSDYASDNENWKCFEALNFVRRYPTCDSGETCEDVENYNTGICITDEENLDLEGTCIERDEDSVPCAGFTAEEQTCSWMEMNTSSSEACSYDENCICPPEKPTSTHCCKSSVTEVQCGTYCDAIEELIWSTYVRNAGVIDCDPDQQMYPGYATLNPEEICCDSGDTCHVQGGLKIAIDDMDCGPEGCMDEMEYLQQECDANSGTVSANNPFSDLMYTGDCSQFQVAHESKQAKLESVQGSFCWINADISASCDYYTYALGCTTWANQ